MPDDEFHDPFEIVEREKWAHHQVHLRGIEVEGLFNPDPAVVSRVTVPFPWEQVKSPSHIEHREDVCPPVPDPCIPVLPQPDIPIPLAEQWAQNIPFPTAEELWAQRHAATDHPLSPGSLHLDGYELPPPHDWNPAEHPLSPGQLHIDANVDSQFPTPDMNEISAPDNQSSIPPPYAGDGTALYHGDTTVTPLHSSHATGTEDYPPGAFAADDDISAYGHLGWG
jgi:hypothetical protein